MIPSTQVTPVQRHGFSCRPFSGPALSTVSINIEGYSQAKAEIVSTFAHGYDIICMQETHIGPEHCRPSIHGMELIAETRYRQYGSAVFASHSHTGSYDLLIVRLVAIWRTCDRSAMFATIARSGRRLRSVFLAGGRSSYDWSYAWSRDQQRL